MTSREADLKLMNFALIFAGGVGRRMNNHDLPKQFLQIGGMTIISLTIEKFQSHEDINGIVIICVESHIDTCKAEVEEHGFDKVIDVVAGGRTAQESILLGLRRLRQIDGGNHMILIHDGVRPIIDADLISRNIDTARTHGNAVTVVDCHETVLFKQTSGQPRYNALDRDSCVIARAPQCYRIDDVLPAAEIAFAQGHDFVDTYSLMEHAGISATPVKCAHTNIKITTYTDLLMAKNLIKDAM